MLNSDLHGHYDDSALAARPLLLALVVGPEIQLVGMVVELTLMCLLHLLGTASGHPTDD
jgi:hypothetical protein